MKDTLYTRLVEYSKSDFTPMHMPGHKRVGMHMVNPYDIDITEIENFDNLHNASGIIQEEQNRLAEIYGADYAYILVNGSTCGNLSAMYSCISRGDKVVIQKNSHKSVYNGLELIGAQALFLEDMCEEMSGNAFMKADFTGISAVVATYPSYNGYLIDIKSLAESVHKAGGILIVDSAHGAHLGFSNSFPENAIKLGADAVIMSLHKTLPALTQVSALLIKGDRVSRTRLEHALDIFETSSPSYVLMSSASICMDYLESNIKEKFDAYARRLSRFYEATRRLSIISVIDEPVNKKDPSKIIISGKDNAIPGYLISETLRNEYHIETEMTAQYQVLALSSIMDEDSLEKLAKALTEIDYKLAELVNNEGGVISVNVIDNEYRMLLQKYKAAKGRISQNMITIYPPGSPVVLAGEEISEEAVRDIAEALAYKLEVTGLSKSGDIIVK